ncbi:MAG: hypothetical protein M3O31_16570 [Acidobacteriota bacterium]|nr:hypothetical protein [Acidobacteriota bacterium]
MRRFTDTDFGFSFWYPSDWKVTQKPVVDPTRGGWFRGAKMVKEFEIHSPATAVDDDQPPGVVLQEIVAPKGLTELGQTESASPVGVDQRYFFDRRAHRWMYSQISDAPDGTPPSTYTAEIRQRTMGGLPVFWGAARHGAEQIVPLDGRHFLAISTMDPGGSDSHVYLAATVVATRPAAGKRAGEQVQTETIRREGIELRAIGASIAGTSATPRAK